MREGVLSKLPQVSYQVLHEYCLTYS